MLDRGRCNCSADHRERHALDCAARPTTDPLDLETIKERADVSFWADDRSAVPLAQAEEDLHALISEVERLRGLADNQRAINVAVGAFSRKWNGNNARACMADALRAALSDTTAHEGGTDV